MKHLYCDDTYVQILLSDEEVEKHWRPRPIIIDKDSNQIEIKEDWNYRQKQYAQMRKRKVKLLENVYCTSHMGYIFFVSYVTGKVYNYKENEYTHVVEDNCIYMIRKSDGERKLIYKEGQFFVSKRVWLRESSPQMSDSHYLGSVLRQRKGDRVSYFYLKDHHLIAVLFFGEEAIYAIGDEINGNGKFQINHRNLYIYDNRPENLEIVTNSENIAHRKIMYGVYENLIREKHGANSEIFWLEDQVMNLTLAS